MKRILVTGGGGFLGGWILRRLAEDGHAVRIFDRSTDRRVLREIAGELAEQVEWVQGDITDGAALVQAARGCSSIIHLAALLTPACKTDPVLGAQVNLIGTLYVFAAAKANSISQLAYASSGAVFGPDDGERPEPLTHYGAFKLATEGCARAYWHDDGISSVGLRPTIVYGPGRESGLTAGPTLACRAAAAGQPYTIDYSGAQDLIFVGDVAAAFAAAATKPITGAHAFSLTGGTADVTEVIAAIEAEARGAQIGFDGPTVPMAAEIARTPFEEVLGAIPQTPLREGIARTLAHYRALASAA